MSIEKEPKLERTFLGDDEEAHTSPSWQWDSGMLLVSIGASVATSALGVSDSSMLVGFGKILVVS